MPTTSTSGASGHRRIDEAVAADKEVTSESAEIVPKRRIAVDDSITSEDLSDRVNLRIEASSSATAKPKAPTKMHSVQIIGADPLKTLFTPTDFQNFKKPYAKRVNPFC